ncbi:hypothetical protein Elgi_47420 [Paenibacillus elgii]|nr:hypothetical protein Elgi_47420 [Paenibacillus elgii]
MRQRFRRDFRQQAFVFEARFGKADVYADFFAGQQSSAIARVFESAPRRLKKKPLVRVHQRRFAWRQPEERVVERINLVQIAALHRSKIPIAGMQMSDISLGVLRSFFVEGPDAIFAFRQIRPELLQRIRLGKLAGHADNRNIPIPWVFRLGFVLCERFPLSFGDIGSQLCDGRIRKEVGHGDVHAELAFELLRHLRQL